MSRYRCIRHINLNTCIKSGARRSLSGKDILGIVDGGAALINASQCIDMAPVFMPVRLKPSLVIGTERRGVDLHESKF
ncbi:MAG: hypothetical protein R2778_07685 [Saprospiraceae bacterium]